MDMLVGKQIVADFVLSPGEEPIPVRDGLEKRSGNSVDGYFLSSYGIQLPLKYSKPDGYDRRIVVTVPKGSSIENQLKEKGFLR